MIRRIFRPFTVITLAGFIFEVIFATKPGIYITHDGPHLTSVLHVSNFVFLSVVFAGTSAFFLLGIIVEVIIWMIKRNRIDD